jgi:hypothetical protein
VLALTLQLLASSDWPHAVSLGTVRAEIIIVIIFNHHYSPRGQPAETQEQER